MAGAQRGDVSKREGGTEKGSWSEIHVHTPTHTHTLTHARTQTPERKQLSLPSSQQWGRGLPWK